MSAASETRSDCAGVASSVSMREADSRRALSLRSRRWLTYDRLHGTLWGLDWATYKALSESLPTSISLSTAAGQRRCPDAAESKAALQERVTLHEARLREEFSCGICLRLLHRPVVVKACMHRFCEDCMGKCVRVGIRECPQCRIHVSSRRAMRGDAAFSTAMQILFGDVALFESKNQEILEAVNKRRCAERVASLERLPVHLELASEEEKTEDPSGKRVCRRDESETVVEKLMRQVRALERRHLPPPAFVDSNGNLQTRCQPLARRRRSSAKRRFAVWGDTLDTAAVATSAAPSTMDSQPKRKKQKQRQLHKKQKQKQTQKQQPLLQARSEDQSERSVLEVMQRPSFCLPRLTFLLVVDPSAGWTILPPVSPNALEAAVACSAFLDFSRCINAFLPRKLTGALQQLEKEQLFDRRWILKSGARKSPEGRLYPPLVGPSFGVNIALTALHHLSLAFPSRTFVVHYALKCRGEGGERDEETRSPFHPQIMTRQHRASNNACV